jgi:hypothetical protein
MSPGDVVVAMVLPEVAHPGAPAPTFDRDAGREAVD